MAESINPARITICPHGPMKVEGLCELYDADGCLVRIDKEVSLCRCGRSQNKPFCDQSHRKHKWPVKDSF